MSHQPTPRTTPQSAGGEHARRADGVALDPDTLAILPEETARLRAAPGR